MTKSGKLLLKISMGNVRNVRFTEMVKLLEELGFRLARISGSHHIFKHDNIDEMVNLQNVGGEAKPYQIRQVVQLIEKYDLAEEM